MSRMALAQGCAREYETIYIQQPAVDKEAVDGVLAKVAEAIKSEDGRLKEIEFWGRRRLAFQIQRHRQGVYVFLKFLGRGNTVAELERQLRLADTVIRYQTLVLDNNIPVEADETPEADTKLDYELLPDTEEAEMTRERELGLDVAPPDRHRGRRDDRDYHGDRGDRRGDGPAKPEGEAKGAAEAKPEGEAKGAAEAKPEGEAKGAAKAEGAETKASPKEEG